MRSIGLPGIRLIKYFEKLHRVGADGLIHPYHDDVGFPTIGWGHLLSKEKWADLSRWQPITRGFAEELFMEDLRPREQAVLRLIRVPLTDGQFDALVSFVFNLGGGALQASTLRAKLNRGDYEGAANEFLRWNKAGGKVLRGLARRRRAERAMFNGSV